MKRYQLTFLAILIVQTFICQIPNSSFENWTSSQGPNWSTLQPSGWFAIFNKPYSQSNSTTGTYNSQTGQLALKSEILQGAASCVYTGFYSGSPKNFYVPLGPKPTKLFGWYIFQNNLDTLTFSVSIKGGGNVIGTGNFYTTITSTVYTLFTMNINYTSVFPADSFRIVLAINNSSMEFPRAGHIGTYFIVDDLFFDITNGIKEHNFNQRLKMFPNPTSEQLVFQILDIESKIHLIEIHDVKGLLINTFTVDDKLFSIDLTGYPPGIYFARLTDQNGQTTIRKFIRTFE